MALIASHIVFMVSGIKVLGGFFVVMLFLVKSLIFTQLDALCVQFIFTLRVVVLSLFHILTPKRLFGVMATAG